MHGISYSNDKTNKCCLYQRCKFIRLTLVLFFNFRVFHLKGYLNLRHMKHMVDFHTTSNRNMYHNLWIRSFSYSLFHTGIQELLGEYVGFWLKVCSRWTSVVIVESWYLFIIQLCFTSEVYSCKFLKNANLLNFELLKKATELQFLRYK